MSKIKSLLIYVLSIIVAFETGLMVIYIAIISAIKDEGNESIRKQRNHVSYNSYYGKKRES